MKKRVLILVRWPIGGINTYLRYVYGNNNFQDYIFDFIVPKIDQVDILIKELNSSNITINQIEGNISKYYKVVISTILKGKYDLVHSHGLSVAIVSVLPARLSSIKHIVTLHDVFTKNQFSGTKGRIKLKLIGYLLSLPNLIQPVSEGAKENLIDFIPRLKKNSDKKIIALLNGIVSNQFLNAVPRDLRKELGFSSDTVIIGFMGRLMSQKGFKYLVLACKAILARPEIKINFKILVFAAGDFIREDSQWVKEIGLEEYFIFLPRTNNVAETLKGLDLLVMPSLWEACGLLAMESLVAGTPLIGSNCDGLGEILDGTPAGIIDPLNINDFADQLLTHIYNNRKYEFENYAPHAAKRFDVTVLINSILKMYKDIEQSL